MSEHRIRLAGPWEFQLDDAWTKVTLPCASTPCASTLVGQGPERTWRRGFHAPSNLTTEDRVWVEFPQEFGEILNVALDDDVLGPVTQNRVELSGRLSGFHRLFVHCVCSDRGGDTPAPTLVISAHDSERE